MKRTAYLKKDLYVYPICDITSFDSNDDNFIVGYLNNNQDKIKDVVTENIYALNETNKYYSLSELERTDSEASFANIMLCLQVKTPTADIMFEASNLIRLIKDNEVVAIESISEIKKIMNAQMKKNSKTFIEQAKEQMRKEQRQSPFAIEDDARNF